MLKLCWWVVNVSQPSFRLWLFQLRFTGEGEVLELTRRVADTVFSTTNWIRAADTTDHVTCWWCPLCGRRTQHTHTRSWCSKEWMTERISVSVAGGLAGSVANLSASFSNNGLEVACGVAMRAPWRHTRATGRHGNRVRSSWGLLLLSVEAKMHLSWIYRRNAAPDESDMRRRTPISCPIYRDIIKYNVLQLTTTFNIFFKVWINLQKINL